jgi:hypothetical protein
LKHFAQVQFPKEVSHMKKKIFALLVVSAFVLNGIGTVLADTNTKKSGKQRNQLSALLPASDGVVTVNIQKLLSEALPQILSGNQPVLSGILGKFEEMKAQTGIDLRQFEQVAIGVTTKTVSAKKIDFEPILLARGSFNPGAILAMAKVAASTAKYREEKIGDKTVYIFSSKKTLPDNNPQTGKTSILLPGLGIIVSSDWLKHFSHELAVTSFDANTLAIGSLPRMRELLQTKTRVAADVLELANRKPNAVISFGAKLPNGMSSLVNLENDELGKNLDAIRQLSGALDVTDGSAAVSLMARTLRPEQAKGLQETLQGLQMLAPALLGSSKGADKKVFARIIENATVSLSGSDVMLDVRIPKSDIDILVGVK